MFINSYFFAKIHIHGALHPAFPPWELHARRATAENLATEFTERDAMHLSEPRPRRLDHVHERKPLFWVGFAAVPLRFQPAFFLTSIFIRDREVFATFSFT